MYLICIFSYKNVSILYINMLLKKINKSFSIGTIDFRLDGWNILKITKINN